MDRNNIFLSKAYESRELVFKALRDFLNTQEKLGMIDFLALDMLDAVVAYAQRGKGFRGVLVTRGYEWFGGADQTLIHASYQVGAAVELLQTGLLIHDDIIDQDDVRRGKPSMHRELEQLAKNQQWQNHTHTGKSLAIVAADLCFFWMQEFLATLDIAAETKLDLISTLARESVHTGIGEAVDVAVSVKPFSEITIKEIEVVNRYKTARYTISLPLLLAARLAGVHPEHHKTIARFGEMLGEVFQLRDDELGLFGTAKEIGKPVGSDIREGKRTIWWCELLERCSEEDKEKLLPLCGNKDLTEEDVEWVKQLVISTGTHDVIKQHIEQLKSQAYVLMSELPVDEKHKQELQDAVAFIINRQH